MKVRLFFIFSFFVSGLCIAGEGKLTLATESYYKYDKLLIPFTFLEHVDAKNISTELCFQIAGASKKDTLYLKPNQTITINDFEITGNTAEKYTVIADATITTKTYNKGSVSYGTSGGTGGAAAVIVDPHYDYTKTPVTFYIDFYKAGATQVD